MNRILELDVLRGFALFGIILGNVTWFSGVAVDGETTLVEGLLHVFVDGKFYSIFSLLFGAGFALGARKFGRRLPALFAVGMAHALLVWFGDIVSLYAVTGVALLAARDWSARRLLRVGVACLAAPIALDGLWLAADALLHVSSGSGHGPAALLPVFETGSYGEVAEANAAFLVDRWYLALVTNRFLRILGMCLLGAAAIRSGVLHRRAQLWRIAAASWPFAAVANVGLGLLGGPATPRPPTLLGWGTDILYSVGAPTGALVLAALVALAAPRLAWLAPAGRLSLTNYVGQSVVMAAIFYGYGLGGWGRTGAFGAMVIAAAIFGAQAIVSALWLRRFGQGPLERLTRALSRPSCG